MAVRVNVTGGTGACVRLPYLGRPSDWTCPDEHQNRGWASRCLTPGCQARRPKGDR